MLCTLDIRWDLSRHSAPGEQSFTLTGPESVFEVSEMHGGGWEATQRAADGSGYPRPIKRHVSRDEAMAECEARLREELAPWVKPVEEAA